MKISKKKNNKKIAIITVVVLFLVSLAGILWLNKDNIFKSKVDNHQNSNLHQEDNTVNYDEPTEEQKNSEFEKEKNENSLEETYPNKLIISNSGKNQAGDYEISAYSSELNNADAICTLTVNGKEYSNAGVQIYPRMAVCKGFTISASDIQPGKNTYEIKIKADNYTDKVVGEF